MQASAAFVSASALGMACGPALAGILQTDFKIYKLTFNQNTLPGWVMGVAWLIYLISLWITFKEPSHEPVENENHVNNHQLNDEVNDALEQGLKQPLLITLNDKGDEEADQDYDDSEEASEESRLPATSIRSAYRLLTPSVKICAQLTVSRRVQLLIYFMVKYVMEILLSESSVITTYYFNWSTSRVALFLACLRLTVLPVNVVVGSYISNMFEDRCQLVADSLLSRVMSLRWNLRWRAL
ncbi:hypothetical protein HN51_070951, partial [Arachis hypogaea]